MAEIWNDAASPPNTRFARNSFTRWNTESIPMNVGVGKPQPPPDPVRVPNADDPDIMAARKLKTQEEFAKRQGRSSTNLAPSDAGYSRTTLG